MVSPKYLSRPYKIVLLQLQQEASNPPCCLAEDRKYLAARQEKAAARQEKAMSFERRLKLAQALNDTATLQKLMDEANEDETK